MCKSDRRLTLFCRKFKFPLKSPDGISPVSPGVNEPETISPKTPDSTTVPADTQSSISAVLSGEPEAEDPSTAPPVVSVTDDQKSADEADVQPERVASPVETQATSIIPDIPVSSEPIAEPIAPIEPVESPKSDHDHPEPSHAHTIDEAIADFQSAVKTPEPESLLPSEGLSAVERDNTLDTLQESSPVKADDPAPASAVNGDTSNTQPAVAPTADKPAPIRHSSDNISATAPRVIAKTPPPPPKEPDTARDDEDGEGMTMEDVDID